jgi:hypothetical protein
MKALRIAGFGALLCFLPCDSASAGARKPGKPAALVYRLTGEAALTVSAQGRRPLRLFEWLAVGTTLEVGSGSRLALAFRNGHRYELGERSRATLGKGDLAFRSGPMRRLRDVPPLSLLLPIAKQDKPGLSAGAVRIRGKRIAGLYPCDGAATLAGATVLSFEPAAGAGTYRIEVQGSNGSLVFSEETTASLIKLPPGALQPGMRYSWTVRTLEQAGPLAQGQANFVTLPARIAKAREALRRAVAREGDAESLALLAEMDRILGLLIESRDELRAAVRASPQDPTLATRLAGLERRLRYLQSP